MPLTMHMIHPRVSLLTSATSMIGCQSPLALSLTRPSSFLDLVPAVVGVVDRYGVCNGCVVGNKDEARTSAAFWNGANDDLTGGLLPPQTSGGRGGAVPLG